MQFSPEAIGSIGAILGAMAGAITFLFRALIESKDSTIKLLTEDRNYWRGVAQGSMSRPSQYPSYPPSNYPPSGTSN